MSHAYYAPSSAHRWIPCAGALKRAEGLPDPDSVFSMEGTLAHKLLDYCLVEGEDPSKMLGVDTLVELDPDSDVPMDKQPIVIDQDMIDAVAVTLQYVETKWGELTNPTLFSETSVDIAEDCSGTADIILMSLEGRYLEVIDFKYGKGIAVDAQDNEQLLTYAVGACNMVAEASEGDPLDFITIRTTIVQPRGFHPDGPIRSAAYIPSDIDMWESRVKEAIAAEKEADATMLTPGEKQCQWCPAKDVCEVRSQWKAHATFKVLDGGDGAGLWSKPVEQLSAGEIKDILDNADALISRISQVRAGQIKQIMAGGEDMDYKVTRSTTKRTFKLSTEETITLLNKKLKFKKVDIERKQLQTISQLDKVAKSMGFTEEKQALYDELFFKPEGTLQLVHKSEKGRAIKPAAVVFQPVVPTPEVEFDFLA